MSRNDVTIMVVPQERFSYSRQSLESIFNHKLIGCAEETSAWIVGPIYWIGKPAGKVVQMAGGRCRRVTTGLVRVAESVGTRFARRKGHGAGRAPIEIAR